jgi:hypothetical protein
LGSEGEKMKKYLLVVLSMLFVLGFAAQSFAIHAAIPAETTAVVAPKGTEIRLGGELRIRGWYEDNITTAAGAKAALGRPYAGGSMSWYDQMVRLLLDVRVAPNVTGRVHLETAGENYTWGAENTLVTGGGTWGTSATDIDLREAWIAYTGKGLLGVPSGIRLGTMPLVVGEGTFFDHRRRGDSAILLWIEPAKGTDINLVTAKLFESTPTDNTNDVDLYSLIFTHKLDKDNTIGANLSLITSSDVDGAAAADTRVRLCIYDNGTSYVTTPGTGCTPTYLLGTLMSSTVLSGSEIAPTLGSLSGFYRMPTPAGTMYTNANVNLWNLGLLAKGKVSGIGYKATLDFQFGKVKDMTGAITDVKFSGYGITLGANYKLDPVTLRANYVYGSGDDTITDNKNKAFQTFVGNVIDPNLPTVVYNWRVHSAVGALGTGIANTTAYNLGLTFSPIKDMTAHLDYYLLRASKRLAATPDTLGYDKDIGSELDLKLAYKIARNLTYSINSGILFAGDFYRDTTAGVVRDPKNAVVFQHGIVLSF